MRVHVVEAIDLAHDGRHIVGHVGGEHAGFVQVRIVRGGPWVALCVALKPFGMSLERVSPVEIGAHAGDGADAALFGGGVQFAEEVAVTQVFALPWKGTFVW